MFSSMDYPTFLLLVSFLYFSWFLIFNSLNYLRPNKSGKLPPGPRPLPVIGNILELGTKPHQSLAELSKIHGPLMTLKLGAITTVVISSPDIAREALQQNDVVFSGRTVPHGIQVHDHHKFSIGFMPPSFKWRVLRRACATNIFSTQQLHSTQILRRKKVQDLLDYVHECCSKNQVLDIGEAIFTTALNSLSNTFFSMDFAGFSSDSSQEFKGIISGALEETGKPNVADFFPILRLIDPQGVYTRMENYSRGFLSFIDNIIEERLKLRDSNIEQKVCKDVLDSFLSLIEEENSQLNRVDVLHLFADLLVAGVDTTSITIEWAMKNLGLPYEECSPSELFQSRHTVFARPLAGMSAMLIKEETEKYRCQATTNWPIPNTLPFKYAASG
ncbi:hypothetical protein L6164_003751 [Bauhinia variegata]|uniref:Uncharacterized protein n=1 Tax=Bauhinia variegata TaxID=167791 RepID=A0ACB9Q2C1_BAUVA|nr:hypothetical protein L6164_003751 [Bauhinia variegata]